MINFTKHSRVDHGEIVDQNRPGPEIILMIHHLDQQFTIRTQGVVEGQR